VQVRLGTATHARLDVYDARGRIVRNLIDGGLRAGQHAFAWDGRDDRGVAVASGVYLARLQAGKHATTRRMVLLK
jgi:flagellar hook assembly protein FlgD